MNHTTRNRVSELTSRTCRSCLLEKSVDLFNRDRGLPTKLCKACHAEQCRNRYRANAEVRRELERARRAACKAEDPSGVSRKEHERYWQKKKRDPIGYLLARLKNQAKTKGVPFDLSREDIFLPEHCPILGVKLSPIVSARSENSPEVDRVIPALGYVRGNVAVISARANRMKDNGSAQEHERIAAWMRNKGAP